MPRANEPPRFDYLLRTGFPMRKVARKMVNAPSDVIALPMTGMVDIDITISYMCYFASIQSSWMVARHSPSAWSSFAPSGASASNDSAKQHTAHECRNRQRRRLLDELPAAFVNHRDAEADRAQKPPQELVPQGIERVGGFLKAAHTNLDVPARGQVEEAAKLARQGKSSERGFPSGLKPCLQSRAILKVPPNKTPTTEFCNILS